MQTHQLRYLAPSTRYLLALCALLVALIPLTSIAQSPNQTASQALEINPPVLPLSGDPGEVITAQIAIRDVSDSPLVVKGEINDFVAAGEDGTPKILLEEGETSPYSMKSWFGPLSTLTLKPKQIENLPITITIPANAAPGGYYSVIRFTATPPEMSSNGVSLSASLGALVMLQVKGDVTQKMNLEEFFVEKDAKKSSFIEAAPLDFVVRIRNEGTIHEQPTGVITVNDMFGNKTAGVNVNLERRNVLPGSIRRFQSPLDKSVIGDKILFGRYTAELSISYGSDKTTISTLSFWVIPWKVIVIGIGALIAIFVLLRLGIKRYNEYIISKSSPRRRRR